MTPDLQANALPEVAHDAERAARLDPIVPSVPAMATRLKQRPGLRPAVLQIPSNRIDDGRR